MGIPNIGLNPNIILQGTSEPQTPELQTPAQNMDALARIRQYQQQAALAPLKMQEAKNAVDEGTQKVQAASRVQQYQSAISQILAKNSSTDPTTGELKVNQDAVMDGLNKAGFGPEGIKYDADRRADLKSAFDASEQQYKIQGAQNARLGALAASVPTVDWTNPDTDAVAAQKLAAQTRARYALQTALKEKVIDPQYEAKIESQLQNYGPDVEAQLQQFSNSAMDAAKQKEQVLAIHKDTRDALLFPSQLDKSKADATKAQTEAEAAEVAAAIKKLSQAKTVEAYAQILGDLPHRIAVQVPAAPGQAQPVSTPPVQPPPSTAAQGPPAPVAGTPNAVPTSVMAPAVPATGAPPQANTNVGSGAGPAPAGAPVSTAPSQPIPPQPQSVPAAPVAAPPPVTAPAQPGGTPLPEGFSQSLLESGMTPEQIAQSRQRAASNITDPDLALAQAKAENPKGTPAQWAVRARQLITQDKIASRPITNINAAATPGVAGIDQQITGQDYIDKLPKPFANQVKAIAEGRQGMPTGAYARSPQGKLLTDAVFQYDPDWSTQRAQARKAFGPGTTDGRNIRNLDTAVVHLDQLADIAKALDNGTFQPGNAVYNSARTIFGSAMPTNYEALRDAVAGEMDAALHGSSTIPGREAIKATMPAKNAPGQMNGVIDTNLHTLGAKLNTYQESYNQQIPGDRVWTPVLPSARAVFDKHGIDPTAGPGRNVSPATGRAVNPNPNGYVAGHVYGGMTFLGGDPNSKASWKQ